MPQNFLESKFAEPYNAFVADPSRTNKSVLLTALKPTISRGIRANIGMGATGATTESHARRLALQALRTYDPARSGLGTHVTNHLQGLRRIQRHQTHILSTPERVSLDQQRLVQAANELEDRLGEEPTSQQLADYTGVSPTRIEYVRKFKSPLATGMLSTITGPSGEGTGFSPAVQQQRASQAWLQAVYGDLNQLNKKIMEWSLGLYGQEQLSNQAIAAKLGLTPGAITQRKAAIQQMLDKERELSPF